MLWLIPVLSHISFSLLTSAHLELLDEIKVLQAIPHEFFTRTGGLPAIFPACLILFLLGRLMSSAKEFLVSGKVRMRIPGDRKSFVRAK
jgi:hypothetical protein